MDTRIAEIAQRIKGLREILEISAEEMAEATDTTVEEYTACESGSNDFSFTFLHKCAEKFGVDIVELLTGENPHLSFFTVTKKGHGVTLNRRSGFHYQHMAHNLKINCANRFWLQPFILKKSRINRSHSPHTKARNLTTC